MPETSPKPTPKPAPASDPQGGPSWGSEEPPPWGESAPQPSASAPDTPSPMASRIQALKEAMDQKTTAAPVRENAVPQQVSSEVSPPVKQEVVASGPLVEGDEWSQVVGSLKLIPMIREFANNCFFEQKEGAVIHLSLSKRHETYRSDSSEQRLKQALSEHYGEDITLQFSVQNEVQNTPAQQAIRRAEQAQLEAEAAIENDAVVSGLKEMFGATVIPGSVKPL